MNVKKKYGMIKSRTKDMKITEVLHRMEQYKQEFIECSKKVWIEKGQN